MPLEYEIKYVLYDNNLEEDLKNLALDNNKYSVVLIEQHYLSKNSRIRKTTPLIKKGSTCKKSASVKYMFAYKPKINGSVIEIETRIDEEDFRLLLPNTRKNLLKVRFLEEKPCENEHWIVDFFKYKDETYFVQAECELYKDNKQPKRMPDFVYTNIALTVDVGNSNFSSRNLCDVVNATDLYKRITGGNYAKETDA